MGTETRVTADPDRPYDRRVPHLTTVDFTPLPVGWRNVYRDVDGALIVEDCPGVVTVRETGHTLCWDQVDEDGRRRVVSREVEYAQAEVELTWRFAGRDGARVEVADDVTNYVKTVGPTEDVE